MADDEAPLFWIGPYDVLVPSIEYKVTSADEVNWFYCDGTETRMCNNGKLLSQQEYYDKFCHRKAHSEHWFWGKP